MSTWNSVIHVDIKTQLLFDNKKRDFRDDLNNYTPPHYSSLKVKHNSVIEPQSLSFHVSCMQAILFMYQI